MINYFTPYFTLTGGIRMEITVYLVHFLKRFSTCFPVARKVSGHGEGCSFRSIPSISPRLSEHLQGNMVATTLVLML